MRRNNSILLVIGTLAKGGAEIQLLRLAKALKKYNCNVDMIVFEKGGILEKKAIESTNNLYFCNFRSDASKLSKVIQLLVITFRIFKMCRAKKYDVVQSYLPMANFIGALGAKIGGVKKIVTGRRALNTHQDRVPLWKYMDKLSTMLSDHVTCNAIMVKEDCIKREGFSDKFIVINNIAEKKIICRGKEFIRHEMGISSHDFVFIVVANIIPYKGHRYLIDALAILSEHMTNIKLLVIGEDRGCMQDLKCLVNKYGLESNVRWLGLVSDVSYYFEMADAYVSSSLEEGFSNSIMEAMQFGLPIVATDVGGTSELLCQGRYGILVPPQNSVSLANAMEMIVVDYDKYIAMGVTAKDYLDTQFSEERILSQYKKIYSVS